MTYTVIFRNRMTDKVLTSYTGKTYRMALNMVAAHDSDTIAVSIKGECN